MACMETGVQNQDPVCAAAGRMCEQITKRLQDPGAQQVTVVVPGSPPSYNTGGFMRAVQAADFNRALKQRRREAHEVKPKPLTTSQDVARSHWCHKHVTALQSADCVARLQRQRREEQADMWAPGYKLALEMARLHFSTKRDAESQNAGGGGAPDLDHSAMHCPLQPQVHSSGQTREQQHPQDLPPLVRMGEQQHEHGMEHEPPLCSDATESKIRRPSKNDMGAEGLLAVAEGSSSRGSSSSVLCGSSEGVLLPQKAVLCQALQSAKLRSIADAMLSLPGPLHVGELGETGQVPIPATLLALAAGPQEEPSRPLRLVHPPAGAQTAFRPAAQLAERLAQLQHLQHSPNGRTISGGAGLRAAPVAAQLAQVHDEQVELEKDWPRPQQRERQLLEGHPCAHTSAEEVARVCGWEAEDDTTSGSQLEEGLDARLSTSALHKLAKATPASISGSCSELRRRAAAYGFY